MRLPPKNLEPLPESGEIHPNSSAGFSVVDTPWKISNRLHSLLCHPLVRLQFALNRIPWGPGWRFYGLPILQKHRRSTIRFGPGLQLRSALRSNPLAPHHPVFLTTFLPGARLLVGADFAMTGGVLCAFQEIRIGDHVRLGANCTITDTDFHPLDPLLRRRDPRAVESQPVSIDDDAFIGMNSIILKGVHIGSGAVVGAGSVVTRDIPAGVLAAGNPARVIRPLP